MEADEAILIGDLYPMMYTFRSEDRELNEETMETGENSRAHWTPEARSCEYPLLVVSDLKD